MGFGNTVKVTLTSCLSAGVRQYLCALFSEKLGRWKFHFINMRTIWKRGNGEFSLGHDEFEVSV